MNAINKKVSFETPADDAWAKIDTAAAAPADTWGGMDVAKATFDAALYFALEPNRPPTPLEEHDGKQKCIAAPEQHDQRATDGQEIRIEGECVGDLR